MPGHAPWRSSIPTSIPTPRLPPSAALRGGQTAHHARPGNTAHDAHPTPSPRVAITTHRNSNCSVVDGIAGCGPFHAPRWQVGHRPSRGRQLPRQWTEPALTPSRRRHVPQTWRTTSPVHTAGLCSVAVNSGVGGWRRTATNAADGGYTSRGVIDLPQGHLPLENGLRKAPPLPRSASKTDSPFRLPDVGRG